MKNTTKADSKQQPAKPEATSQPAPATAVHYVEAPPPDFLLHLAEQEPDQAALRDYFPVIEELRSKNFSFREIAKWLTDHGVEADYNAVYRVFNKYLTPLGAVEEEERERQEAQDESDLRS